MAQSAIKAKLCDISKNQNFLWFKELYEENLPVIAQYLRDLHDNFR